MQPNDHATVTTLQCLPRRGQAVARRGSGVGRSRGVARRGSGVGRGGAVPRGRAAAGWGGPAGSRGSCSRTTTPRSPRCNVSPDAGRHRGSCSRTTTSRSPRCNVSPDAGRHRGSCSRTTTSRSPRCKTSGRRSSPPRPSGLSRQGRPSSDPVGPDRTRSDPVGPGGTRSGLFGQRARAATQRCDRRWCQDPRRRSVAACNEALRSLRPPRHDALRVQ